jgi:hypothetical protein
VEVGIRVIKRAVSVRTAALDGTVDVVEDAAPCAPPTPVLTLQNLGFPSEDAISCGRDASQLPFDNGCGSPVLTSRRLAALATRHRPRFGIAISRALDSTPNESRAWPVDTRSARPEVQLSPGSPQASGCRPQSWRDPDVAHQVRARTEPPVVNTHDACQAPIAFAVLPMASPATLPRPGGQY